MSQEVHIILFLIYNVDIMFCTILLRHNKMQDIFSPRAHLIYYVKITDKRSIITL